MGLINKLWVKLALAGLLVLAGGLGTWKVLDWKHKAERMEAAEQQLYDMAEAYLKSFELQHELQDNLKAANADAARVSRKLRDYLSRPAPGAPGAAPAGEEPGSTEGAGEGTGLKSLDTVIDAGQSDAVYLTGWQKWCASIDKKIRPKGC